MLDLHSNQEKFGSFLRAALDVLSQLLELATLNDINKVRGRVEELLLHKYKQYMQLILLHVLIVCGGNLGLPQVLFLQRTDHGYCVCTAGQ